MDDVSNDSSDLKEVVSETQNEIISMALDTYKKNGKFDPNMKIQNKSIDTSEPVVKKTNILSSIFGGITGTKKADKD